MNRNKRSVTINLKNADGLKLAKKLADESDVLVENVRCSAFPEYWVGGALRDLNSLARIQFIPGKVAHLGLGYDELKKSNPGLIYCAVSGMLVI